MATPQRQPAPDLIDRLAMGRFAEGNDFFEIVRVIERLVRAERAEPAEPAERGARIGHDGPPQQEPVRFCVAQHRNFAAQAVARQQHSRTDRRQIELAVTFMGLTGPSGVLPSPYAKLVQSRLRQRDTALADFFDLFNHRLLSLFYRAWAKYRPAQQLETQTGDLDEAPFQRALAAIAGRPHMRRFEPRLFYAGHFSRAQRSAGDLERMASDFLNAPVALKPYIGHWLAIADPDRLRIGRRSGVNHQLGAGVMPGTRVWDIAGKFALEIGPIGDERYAELTLGTREFEALRRLIDDYVPIHLAVELRFIVRGPRRSALGRSLQLGRNCWLQRDTDRLRTARIQLRRYRQASI